MESCFARPIILTRARESVKPHFSPASAAGSGQSTGQAMVAESHALVRADDQVGLRARRAEKDEPRFSVLGVITERSGLIPFSRPFHPRRARDAPALQA